MEASISKKNLREFGLIIGFGFPIVIGWIIPLLGGHFFRIWTLWIAIPAIIIGIFKPILLLYPYKVWMKIGYILGWINSRIILGLVYLLVLLPIAFIMKIFGYDPLKINKSYDKTYREIKKNNKIILTKIF